MRLRGSVIATSVILAITLPSGVARADVLVAPGNVRIAAAADGLSMRVSWDDNSGGEIGFEVNNGEESRTVAAGTTSYVWQTLPLSYMCVHVRSVEDGAVSEWVPNAYPWYVCTETPNSADAGAFAYSPSGDQRGFAARNCTAWVAHRLNRLNGIDFRNNLYPPERPVHWGNAYEWQGAADRAGLRTSILPALGAVAWYSHQHPKHPAGHVAYVERVNRDGSILVSEMNYLNHGEFRFQTLRAGDADWPTAFLHVADRRPAGTPG